MDIIFFPNFIQSRRRKLSENIIKARIDDADFLLPDSEEVYEIRFRRFRNADDMICQAGRPAETDPVVVPVPRPEIPRIAHEDQVQHGYHRGASQSARKNMAGTVK